MRNDWEFETIQLMAGSDKVKDKGWNGTQGLVQCVGGRAWRAVWMTVLLSGATLVAYWPVLDNDFIGLDDGRYVKHNPHVAGGLTWQSAGWAFRAGYAANWHPLTWVSHMLDAQVYGLNPRGHHLTNLLLHTANAALLFLLLRRMTGAEWRSVLVAGLFALHPLHVESVAWVAERKDVLSTFFFLLTLGAYAAYVARESKIQSPKSKVQSQESEAGSREAGDSEPPNVPGHTDSWLLTAGFSHALRITQHAAFWYILALGLFACGLMSKGMLVTTPFVLLLLDFWPLGRLRWPAEYRGERMGHIGPMGALGGMRMAWGKVLSLFVEKAPFFCLTIAASIVTFMVQKADHAMSLQLPLGARLANAVASYWKYLGKTVWPVDLAIFYPHPDTRYPDSQQWPGWIIIAAGSLLAVVSVCAVLGARRRPWALTGWFWYLGTLVPVIGIVQVGVQAMADRYSYIPLIGVFICIGWSAAEMSGGSRLGRMIAGGAAALALIGCGAATQAQTRYWRNNVTLFEHALRVAPQNAPAHFELGCAVGGQGNFEAAIAHFRAALKADPGYLDAYYSLGLTLEGLGQAAAAAEQYQAGLRVAPTSERLHNRLGAALWMLGRREEAVKEFTEAVRLDPAYGEAQYRLGIALSELGRQQEAAAHLAEALRLGPDNVEILNGLAWRLATHPQAAVRNGAEAVRLAERACRLSGGKDPQDLGTLDAAYAEAGRFAEAIRTAERARDLALGTGEKELAQAAEYRLGLYRKEQAYHRQ